MRNDVLLRRSLGFAPNEFELPEVLKNLGLVFYLPLEALNTYNLTDQISGNTMEFSTNGSYGNYSNGLFGRGMVQFTVPNTLGQWVGKINPGFTLETFPTNEFTVFSVTCPLTYTTSSSKVSVPVVLSPSDDASDGHPNQGHVTTANYYYAAFSPCPPAGKMVNSSWVSGPTLYASTLSESGRRYSYVSTTGGFTGTPYNPFIPYLPQHFLQPGGEYPENSGDTYIGSNGYLYFGANVLSNCAGTQHSISNYAIFNKVLTNDEILEFRELVETGEIIDLLPM